MNQFDLTTQIRTFFAVALAVGVGVVGANVASAGFADTESSPFAESVNRVQEAGIATGYADGTFRPREDINRQQAAAWLDRSMGRVGLDINGGLPVGPTLTAADPSAVVSTLEMSSPAVVGGSGWVTIQGGVGGVALQPGATCPCPVSIEVLDEDDNVVGVSRLVTYADPTGQAFVAAPVIAVTPIAGGDTHTYRVVATLLDTSDEVLVGAALYASYSPVADGEPAQQGGASTASEAGDPVESMVPELP
jgi:hypothetical protein